MNFDKEAKSDKKNWGGGRGAATETKTVCQTVSNEVNTKMQLSTKCRTCGTINISKYVNIFLSINTTTFILSSLVKVNFAKEFKSEFSMPEAKCQMR